MSEAEQIAKAIERISAHRLSRVSTPAFEDRLCPTCKNLGGKGPVHDEYGLSHYRAWCACKVGQRMAAEYDTARAALVAEDAPHCPKCNLSGGREECWDQFGFHLFREWCDCDCGQAGKAKYEGDYRQAVEDERRKHVETLWERAGVPPRYANARLTDVEPTVAEQITDWLGAATEGNGLLIIGEVGTGKSHLSAAVLRLMVERQMVSLFAPVPSLLDDVRRSFNARDSADDPFAEVMSAPVVVLDDIGTEQVTPWVLERLFVLVNHRYNHLLTTIVTSNLEPDVLAARVGDRIVSRLAEMCTVVRLAGDDRRILHA